MATKDDCLSFKDKQNVFVDTPDNQYSNLNLNQTYHCLVNDSACLKNFTNDIRKNQNNDCSRLKNLKAKNDSYSWKKSNKHYSSTTFLNQNHNSEENNEFKKAKSANNSTLSLHIAAYENAIEADGNEKESVQKMDKTIGFVKQWETLKHFVDGATSIIQNPFEFPRQQENRDSRPESMQFSASQRLLNPNQMDANNQIQPPPLNAMSGDGRSRKRNLLAGGPKSGPIRSKAPPASKVIDSSVLSAPTPAVVPDSLLPSASAAATQGRRTRQSTLSQRTLEPFTFTQTRPTAKEKPIVPAEDDDDDIQILEEPKPKRRNRKKSEEEDIKESFVIPETLVIPPVNQTSKRQGTPFTAIQSRKDKKSLPLEVIPDSLAEMDEPVENPTKVLTNKRNPKQAGLDEGIGEALKAVKKIKLSTPTPSTADLKNVLLQSTIRSSPPGKIFQKARQGSFYVARPIQRIAVSEMSVWNGDK